MFSHEAAVTEVFAAFDNSPGKIAEATGFPIQTVSDWRKKGKIEIPPWRRSAVLDAIKRLSKSVSSDTLAYLASDDRSPRRAA